MHGVSHRFPTVTEGAQTSRWKLNLILYLVVVEPCMRMRLHITCSLRFCYVRQEHRLSNSIAIQRFAEHASYIVDATGTYTDADIMAWITSASAKSIISSHHRVYRDHSCNVPAL